MTFYETSQYNLSLIVKSKSKKLRKRPSSYSMVNLILSWYSLKVLKIRLTLSDEY